MNGMNRNRMRDDKSILAESHTCDAFESESNEDGDEKKIKFKHKRIEKMFSEDDREGMESFRGEFLSHL